jgi:hypothetical protein
MQKTAGVTDPAAAGLLNPASCLWTIPSLLASQTDLPPVLQNNVLKKAATVGWPALAVVFPLLVYHGFLLQCMLIP